MATATVALCLGDPAGIGPELVARVLADPMSHERTSVVAVGERATLERARALVGSSADIIAVEAPRDARSAVDHWALAEIPGGSAVADGVASEAGGRAAGGALVRAVELARAGQVDAIAAAPSNKRALHLADYAFEDHTAFLGHLLGVPEPLLMPVAGDFRLVSVTNHVSMAETCRLLSRDLVLRTTRSMDATLRQMGIQRPRLAVAGLNPHGGEGGDCGDEEIVHIAPAVAAARAEGIDASGPYPADSLFAPRSVDRYDGFVTMYHDQGRIAQKALAFGRIVTITAGLPFFFATVGHGTAYDIAWQGRADAANLRETLAMATAAACARVAPSRSEAAVESRSRSL